ncbi:MAG: serpin family protein [Bacteroidales bacterium]|nr:serpin family protein [Bacteroidales bacterium]
MKYIPFIILSLVIAKTSSSQSKTNIVNNNNEFAFELFAEICKTDTTNVFISPISISSALSMAYDGAKGKTAKEMRKVLRFTKNQDLSHKEITELLNYYCNVKQGLFKIVNAAVAQEKYHFLDSYFALLKDYKAEIKSADFKDAVNREEARKQINKWVMDNTNNKIEELLDQNSLDELTRLVLLNAIHFKADWTHEFPADKTRQMMFYGTYRQYIAYFMNIREKYNYFANEKLEIIEIPYKDSLASMFIILPSDSTNINDFCQTFNYEEFCLIEKQMKKAKVDLQMPKFKIEEKYKLKEALMSMGMISAFTTSANFNNMTGRSDLMIDDVIHQSFIEVDEKGTEAAAATAVVVRQKNGEEVIYLNLNKPFVFLIKEHFKGSVLFLGKFNNP